MRFRARLFFAAGQPGVRHAGEPHARAARTIARERTSGGSGHCDTGAGFGRSGGDRIFGGFGDSVSHGADPQPLYWPDVHRAEPGDTRFWSEAKAEPRTSNV